MHYTVKGLVNLQPELPTAPKAFPDIVHSCIISPLDIWIVAEFSCELKPSWLVKRVMIKHAASRPPWVSNQLTN